MVSRAGPQIKVSNLSSWTLAEWVTFAALIVTALGVILTGATLIIVLLGELRYRRQYHAVDWEIDHIGAFTGANGVEGDRFRLVHIGSVSATSVSLLMTEALPATSEHHRPISYMMPGQSQEFVAQVVDLDKAWVLLSWTPVNDRRLIEYEWLPLKPDGKLADHRLDQMGISKRARRELVKSLGGKPAPVGPDGVLFERINAKTPEKRRVQIDRASQHGFKWLKDQAQAREKETSVDGTPAS